MRFRRKRQASQPPPGSDAHMMATLAELGIPASFEVSDPMAALSGGFAKASIYQAHQALQAGNTDETISAATAVIEYPGLATDQGMADVVAVAFYLRGSAREANDADEAARADYRETLAKAPNHAGARAGLDRLG